MTNKKTSTNLSDEDLLAIEKKLLKLRTKELKVYSFYHNRPFKLLFVNLMEGIAKGIGFVIGGTVIVAITALILTKYFSEIPVVGEYFNQVGQWLETNQEAQNTD
jgi:hypothetical protein